MTDHVSIIAPRLQPAPLAPETPVQADGWFPPVLPSQIRAEQRINATVTDTRLLAAIRTAIATVLIDVSSWADARREAGHTSLASVPSRTVDGVSLRVRAWYRAVGALARQELVETSLDHDATGRSERSASTLDPTISNLRRDATHAIRDLMDQPRTRVALL